MHHLNPMPCRTRHAIILAAGESKRTRPLTAQRPKPLIPLLGKPLLAHILDELVGLVTQVTLVVGYRAEAIEASFGASYRGLALRYVRQTEVNGTASALMAVVAAGDLLDEPFFLLYGDNLISQDDLRAICRWRYGLSALRVDNPRSFGVLELRDGRVLRILEKPEHPPADALANPGIYHFDSEAFTALQHIRPSPRGEYELTDLIGILAQVHPINYSICTGYWVPVGTPWEALNAVAFLLARRAAQPPAYDPEAVIPADCIISGAVQVGRARLGAGCRIVGPALIGDGCVIGDGCLIEGSVLDSGVTLGERCVVQRSALGAGVGLDAGCYVQSSFIDDGVSLGAGVQLRERSFADIQPAAATGDWLNRSALLVRGCIVGSGVTLSPATRIEPGTIVSR